MKTQLHKSNKSVTVLSCSVCFYNCLYLSHKLLLSIKSSHNVAVLVRVLVDLLDLEDPPRGIRTLRVWGGWGQGSSLHQPLVSQRFSLEGKRRGEKILSK